MAYTTIPGLGPETSARITEVSRQVIVVSAPDRVATTNTLTLWERAGAHACWTRVGHGCTGHNGANGWSSNHREGDLTTPVGVFTLTAAGGGQPDPGTMMPYEYRPSYYRAGGGSGEHAVPAAFDHVVAIDYNRRPGYPPSDPTRPLGAAAGGDIWLHVDHDSPTDGCVTVALEELRMILAWLSPARRPMIVMGYAASLAR